MTFLIQVNSIFYVFLGYFILRNADLYICSFMFIDSKYNTDYLYIFVNTLLKHKRVNLKVPNIFFKCLFRAILGTRWHKFVACYLWHFKELETAIYQQMQSLIFCFFLRDIRLDIWEMIHMKC